MGPSLSLCQYQRHPDQPCGRGSEACWETAGLFMWVALPRGEISARSNAWGVSGCVCVRANALVCASGLRWSAKRQILSDRCHSPDSHHRKSFILLRAYRRPRRARVEVNLLLDRTQACSSVSFVQNPELWIAHNFDV